MKKFFFFLLSFMFCINIISAKTISHVACFYKILNPSGDHMTDAQIQIMDYNDGAGGRVVVFFKDASGNYLNYAETGPSYEWKNYGTIDTYPNAMLRFFTTDKKGETFIKNYKASGKCPSIYSNITYDGNSIDIENHSLDPETGSMTSKNMSTYKEKLKSGNGDWVDRADFFKDDSGNTTEKEDLVCSYDMEFDMFNIKSPVEFRTIYNPTNNTKSYKISVNQSSVTLSNLNEDAFLNLAQGGGSEHGIVYVSSTELKNIFKDTCLERNKVYHYYDMSSSRYTITTNQQEASENGAGGRYDNGDGSNDGNAGGSTPGGSGAPKPDLNFNENTMTCTELLGSNMIKVIKAAITLIRIGATIATILIGMMNFLPALTKGDAGAFNAAVKKSIWLVVVLMLIILLPVLLRTIGNLFSWDLCGIV